MCGINGIFSFNKDECLSPALEMMNELIIHRGPDDSGFYFDKNRNGQIGMAMRRLSIIDLDKGKQPISNEKNDIVLVFNGEIYNYRELKKEYLNDVKFKTESDTEVILKLYEKYGTMSFEYLDGMYAFSIYDKKLEKIILARDYFGEKPLYYTQNENHFIWASELKSLVSQLKVKPEINHRALKLYFSLTYIPAPYSIYNDVFKLEPNHFLEYFFEKQKFTIHSVHRKNLKRNMFEGGFDDAKKRTEDLVRKSVVSRSISDVPIGTFLSGGVDSSIVSLCLADNTMGKINTFSIGFEKKSFDESTKARAVAKLINSSHHEFIINESYLSRNINSILNNFDEPFADSSALPTFLVSKMTSAYVKVALTGDGGDEVFGGYNKYLMHNINQQYTKYIHPYIHGLIKKGVYPFLKVRDDDRGRKFKIKKVLDSVNYNGDYFWNIISLGFMKNDLTELLIDLEDENHFDYYQSMLQFNKKETSLFHLRQIDKHISLEGDMLVKVDRTSMMSSIECRAPFLNKEIWDFTDSLPDTFLINKKSKKHILKAAFQQYFPNGFLDSPKRGFGIPVGDWLRRGLYKELLSFIERDFIHKQGIFNYDYVCTLVMNHVNSLEDNTFKVWTFFCFQKWYKSIYLSGND